MTQMSANGQTVPDLRILDQLRSGALAPERALTGVWLHLPRGRSIESRRDCAPGTGSPDDPSIGNLGGSRGARTRLVNSRQVEGAKEDLARSVPGSARSGWIGSHYR
jgi:hypothetical protein